MVQFLRLIEVRHHRLLSFQINALIKKGKTDQLFGEQAQEQEMAFKLGLILRVRLVIGVTWNFFNCFIRAECKLYFVVKLLKKLPSHCT